MTDKLLSFKVNLLTKDNYPLWALQVKTVLIEHGVWEIVSGILPTVNPNRQPELPKKTSRKLFSLGSKRTIALRG